MQESNGIPKVDLESIADAGSNVLYIVGIILSLIVIAGIIYFYRKAR